MKLVMDVSTLKVIREKGDPSYSLSKGGWGSPESRLLFHILKALNNDGYDLIKKRMWKDGHLVSEDQLYIRSRKARKGDNGICIWNGSYQVYDAARELMEMGEVTLNVERDFFKIS